MNSIEAREDPNLFGPWFQGDSWEAWKAHDAARYGLPMTDAWHDVYQRCTGRKKPPSGPAREVLDLCGRRCGKSRNVAMDSTYKAAFIDYRQYLAPGEFGVLPIVSTDRTQSRVIFGYVNGFFDEIPMLRKLVTNRTKESIELGDRRVIIEVRTASWRSLRGMTTIGGALDELAFWHSDERSANPAGEIIAGLKPSTATIPTATITYATTPYSRTGPVFDMFRRHYGVEDDRFLVWRAPSIVMNPTLDQSIIDDAFEEDPQAAASEWNAEFRADIENFIGREAVEACIIPGRHEIPPAWGTRYFAAADPAGGSGGDSFGVAIAHEGSGGCVVIDATREIRSPFNPESAVAELSELLHSYWITSIRGDRYAGSWPTTRFADHGITYEASEMPKSVIYQTFLPILNSGGVELLDDRRLVGQLLGLERRTSRSGRDSIDHGPRGHDDVANVVALVAVITKERTRHGIREIDLYGI